MADQRLLDAVLALPSRRALRLLAGAGLGVFVALEALELYLREGGVGARTLFFEAAEISIALVAVFGLLRVLEHLRRETERSRMLASDFEAARRGVERSRAQLLARNGGLGAVIELQFQRWQLTGAEQEVGFLVLKGLNHREISELRGTTVETARQQARSIYRKAGVGGRAEFSAHFLEFALPARARPEAGLPHPPTPTLH